MGITFNNCLVFSACVQKVAESRISIQALNTNDLLPNLPEGEVIVVDRTSGQATVNGNPVEFLLCCQEPRFQTRAPIENKVINCGWVPAHLIVKDANAGTSYGCIDVALPFQTETEAPGTRRSDFVNEFLTSTPQSFTCIVFDTVPYPSILDVTDEEDNGTAVIPTPTTDPFLIMKCEFIVQLDVTREEKVLPDPCTAEPPCVIDC